MALEILAKSKKGNFFVDIYEVINGKFAGEYDLKRLSQIIKSSNETPVMDEHTKRALEILGLFNEKRKEIWINGGEPKRKKRKVIYLQMDLGTYSL